MSHFESVIVTDETGLPIKLEENGAVAVQIQDQHSPALIVPMNKVANTTTSVGAVAIDDNTVDVANVAGFVDGAFITVVNAAANRYYTAKQVGAISGSTVTLDTPFDFAFPDGSQVTNGSIDMAVDGSITTQVFSLRAADPGIPVEIDITRIIFKCLTATAVSAEKFGDLTELTNGIVLRKASTVDPYYNIFNVKSNLELAGIMYDFTVYEAINPTQGTDGFVGRLTFAGQNKIGVSVRVGPNDDLELLVQDDLSGLVVFEITVEGHVVED